MPAGQPPTTTDSTISKGVRITREASSHNHNARQLSSSVPTCAQLCLATNINQGFSCSQGDLSCLCSHYSTDGYTLGELAFVCVEDNCPQAADTVEFSAFDVCSAQPNRVSATHSIITLSATTTIPESKTTSSASEPSSVTVFVTSTSSGTISTTSAVPQSSVGSSITSTPGSTTPSSAATTSSSGSSGGSGGPGLTTAQAVGVTVASMGALAVAIGIVFLVACMRRRKKAKRETDRHSYDFVDNAPRRFSPSNPGPTVPQGPNGGITTLPSMVMATERRNSDWHGQHTQLSYQEHDRHREDAPGTGSGGIRAVSPRSDYSNTSNATTEQLLPERGDGRRSYGSPPHSHKFSVQTPATVFEEERKPRMSGALLRPGLPLRPSAAKLLPMQPSWQPQVTNQVAQSTEGTRHVPLSIQIPRRLPRAPSTPEKQTASRAAPPPPFDPVGRLRPVSGQSKMDGSSVKAARSILIPPRIPLPVRTTEHEQATRTLSKVSGQASSTNSVLDYYASADSGLALSKSLSEHSTTPIEDGSEPRPTPVVPIVITQPTYPPPDKPPQSKRSSSGSETSNETLFEASDSEELKVPRTQGKKSNPGAKSTISGLQYPKIPKSSTPSVPQSPTDSTSSTKPIAELEAQDSIAALHDPRSSPQAVPTFVTPDNGMSGHQHTLSGSTLAAKRRGDSVAQDLERGLYIAKWPQLSTVETRAGKESDAPTRLRSRQLHKVESPLKGYGDSAKSAGRAPDWPLPAAPPAAVDRGAARTRAQWEPTLTPRKGEEGELYLSVSENTP